MESEPSNLNQPDQIFRGFRIATFANNDVAYGQRHDCILAVTGGNIDWILPDDEVPALADSVQIIEGDGRWMTPGLIDCHTHLVYGGNRAGEWEMRLAGASYEEISRSGGGILSSVKATRAASIDELVDSASVRLNRLMQEGVTTIEIKSGYGLDLETEIKMLKAAKQLESAHEISVATTLLAAHAIPPEFKSNADQYIDLVCNEIIPAAKPFCSAVDAFCESIAFDVDQTVRVFESALQHDMDIKVHGEQLTHTGISAKAATMGAVSADHLEYLTHDDCQTISQHGTVATLLPGAFYCLNETQKPPIVALRKHSVPIAVATDCNPGSSPVTSLLLSANMACNLFGLTAEEALRGITTNAAQALGLAESVGTLENGKRADLVVWDVESPAEIVYGVGHNPCHSVYRNGKQIR